jgi:hypothetical protein
LFRVITGDLTPCGFFLFPKMKLKLEGRRFDTIEEIQAVSPRDFGRKGLPGSVPKMEETVGLTGVYMRERTTSRVMAADRPYGEFYDL